MGPVDNWASRAHKRFLEDSTSIGTLDPREIVGWCQFLYSLIVRNPEHPLLIKKKLSELGPEVLEHIRDDYANIRGPSDPLTFDEYKAKCAANPIALPPHAS